MNIFAKIDLYDQLIKMAFIKKLPNGKYRVISRKGKNLGTYNSKNQAKKRLQQIEFFKHKNYADDKNYKKIDLTKADDISYSSITREINKKCSKKQIYYFLKLYKLNFDKAFLKNLQSPEKIALQKTLVLFNKKYPIKLNKIIKNAAITELGDPKLVGKYLANIVKFTTNRISSERRDNSINNLKIKIHNLNEIEIGNKKMPASSSLGQSITFIKNILFNHDPNYIRQVLNSIVENL